VIEVRMDTTKCTNNRIAGFRKCWDLVREGEMFIKDKAKVASWGVVYIMKRRGPRTEPYGTPYEEVCEEERVLPHLTRKERDERYDEKNLDFNNAYFCCWNQNIWGLGQHLGGGLCPQPKCRTAPADYGVNNYQYEPQSHTLRLANPVVQTDRQTNR